VNTNPSSPQEEGLKQQKTGLLARFFCCDVCVAETARQNYLTITFAPTSARL
jgi:hypothetical protein